MSPFGATCDPSELYYKSPAKRVSLAQNISSSHVTCVRHDIVENCSLCIKHQLLTHSVCSCRPLHKQYLMQNRMSD
jgi:hypothetical protein